MAEKLEHQQAEELLSAFLEGELEPAQHRLVEEHLHECECCSRQLKLLRRSLELVRQLPRPEPPADFYLRLRRRAQRRGLLFRRRQGEPWRWLLSLEVAILLLLAAVAMVVLVMLFEDSPLFLRTGDGCRLLLPAGADLESLAEQIRNCGGAVRCDGQTVPAGARLASDCLVTVRLSAPALECLQKTLQQQAAARLECQNPLPRQNEINVLIVPAAPAPPSAPAPTVPASP